MSVLRQVGAFMLVGLGVGLGFAAVDAMFGSRRVVVKDVYTNSTGQQRQQHPPQQQQQQRPPAAVPHSSSSSPSSSPPPAYLSYQSTGSSPAPPPPSRSSSSSPSSSPSAPSPDCYQAVTALADCESRNGFNSPACRFFRQKADECQRMQARFAASQYGEEMATR